MKATLKKLNAIIAKDYPKLNIELVKGDGYFYFIGDDGFDEIDSIYMNALNQAPLDRWEILLHCVIDERYAGQRVGTHKVDFLNVGDGATYTSFTDRQAATIISRTEKQITIRFDHAKLLNGAESGEADALQFSVGGFAAHCEGRQRYQYTRNENGREMKFSRRVIMNSYTGESRVEWKAVGTRTSERGSTLQAGRHHFYDYNF